jgi:hypothetical protein
MNVYQPRLLQIRPQYQPDPDSFRVPENVLWFQSVTAGTPTIPNLESIATAFDNAWDNIWLGWGASDRTYTGCIVTDWSSNTGLEWDNRPTRTPLAGSNGFSLPYNVAALTSIHIAERFKGGHSRCYGPYVGVGAQDTTDPRKWKDTLSTNTATAWTALTGAMSGSGVLGGQLIMVYRFRNNAVRANVQPVVAFTTQPFFASQRRRQRKAAHH